MMAKGSMKRMRSLTYVEFLNASFFTFGIYIVITCYLGLHMPFMNGCTMTCMYPFYIHVLATFHHSINNSHVLYLYNEGYKKIDY